MRAIVEPTRPAEPSETNRETARETVQLRDSNGRSYCTAGADGSPDSLRTDAQAAITEAIDFLSDALGTRD